MATTAIAKAARLLAPGFRSAGASPLGSRALHVGGIKQISEHGANYGQEYLHAEHMYNLPAMTHRKLKMGLGVFGGLAIGIAIPLFAVHFQQKKQAGA